jgi:hypothetical protein
MRKRKSFRNKVTAFRLVPSYTVNSRYKRITRDLLAFRFQNVSVAPICTTRFNISQLRILSTEGIHRFRMILRINSNHFRNIINQLFFVVEKNCVFFGAETEFSNVVVPRLRPVHSFFWNYLYLVCCPSTHSCLTCFRCFLFLTTEVCPVP